MSLVTLSTPVPFGHKENDPVLLVLGLAAPDDEGHVVALATLADFLADEGRRERLIQATAADAVRDMIGDYERSTARAG
jgi:PTS system ascorbate-specific IIA component